MALSSKQRKALREANEDGEITDKESKRLEDLGIPRRQSQPTDSKEKSVLSVKQLNKLQTEIEQNDGAIRNGKLGNGQGGDDDGTSDTVKGSINYTAYGGTDRNALGEIEAKGKNDKIWAKVASELGINHVDTDEDVARLITYVNNYGTKGNGEGEKKVVYGGRGSGEYKDIIASLQADAEAGIATAEELANKTIREVRGTYKDDLRYISDVQDKGLGLGELAISPKGEESISRENLVAPTTNKGGNNKGGNNKGGGTSAQSAATRASSFATGTTYAPGVSVNGKPNPLGNTTTYAPGVSAPAGQAPKQKGNKSAKANAFDNSSTYAPGVSAPGTKPSGRGNGTIDPFAGSLTTGRGSGVTAPNPNREDKTTTTGIAASGFNPADYGSQGLGLKDYEALREQGYNNKEIKSYAEGLKGVQIGSKLQAKLGLDGGIANNFNPADYGAKGLGLKDYDELKARGYNDNQIKTYAEGLQGVTIGGKLQEKLAGIGGGDDGAGDEPAAPSLADILNEQQGRTNDQLTDLRDEYTEDLKGLSLQIEELGSINDNWAAANAFMKEQMLAANTARDLAEKRASNMRNAFVPNANPTALSVLYGDNRKGGRRQQDNQLSDLSILSGLGTNSNPLAGLQLA